MTYSSEELVSWFSQRPKWVQAAAKHLITHGAVSVKDIGKLLLLCKHQAGIICAEDLYNNAPIISASDLDVTDVERRLRINSIRDVRGINALAPRKPLDFGQAQLAVVYGNNGTGKSGYVRILKQACGCKNPGVLHSNVYSNTGEDKKCTFLCSLDNQTTDIPWAYETGIQPDLSSIEIYDTDCANVYVNNENELAYEPGILKLFTVLSEVCNQLNTTLAEEIRQAPSRKPGLPTQFQSTQAGIWYTNLKPTLTPEEVTRKCTWSKDDEQKYTISKQRLKEGNPADKAKELRQKKIYVISTVQQLEKLTSSYSDESYRSFVIAKTDAERKRLAADIDAKKVFENASVAGIGTESWKLLWEKAREFSEIIAYQEKTFPNVSENSRCVLCQQVLTEEAKLRLVSFEDFVKGKLENDAQIAKQHVETLGTQFLEIPSDETLKLQLDAAGLPEPCIAEFNSAMAQLRKRKNDIFAAELVSEISLLPSSDIISILKGEAATLECQAIGFDQLVTLENREILTKQVCELEAQKWVHEQRDSIITEIDRLKYLKCLETARQLAGTQAITVKKSALAEELITSAYIERFQLEIAELGASRIPVEIVKTRAAQGHIYHQIRLKDTCSPTRTNEVLSEGELRIVSLAAFLADVEGRVCKSPFIFDDPISSLDQDFEEASVRRLIKLAQNRQVIVFTHRISLLVQLEEYAKKEYVTTSVVALRSENWGKGEPVTTPLYGKKPINALNSLLDARLSQAKKVLQDFGTVEYDILAKALCSDFRILLERFVENYLLSDIVQRFRRSVETKNKIRNLVKINTDDCKLFEDLMTTYSKYEHSQSFETPVPMPDPQEIENDLIKMKNWYHDFAAR